MVIFPNYRHFEEKNWGQWSYLKITISTKSLMSIPFHTIVPRMGIFCKKFIAPFYCYGFIVGNLWIVLFSQFFIYWLDNTWLWITNQIKTHLCSNLFFSFFVGNFFHEKLVLYPRDLFWFWLFLPPLAHSALWSGCWSCVCV